MRPCTPIESYTTPIIKRRKPLTPSERQIVACKKVIIFGVPFHVLDLKRNIRKATP